VAAAKTVIRGGYRRPTTKNSVFNNVPLRSAIQTGNRAAFFADKLLCKGYGIYLLYRFAGATSTVGRTATNGTSIQNILQQRDDRSVWARLCGSTAAVTRRAHDAVPVGGFRPTATTSAPTLWRSRRRPATRGMRPNFQDRVCHSGQHRRSSGKLWNGLGPEPSTIFHSVTNSHRTGHRYQPMRRCPFTCDPAARRRRPSKANPLRRRPTPEHRPGHRGRCDHCRFRRKWPLTLPDTGERRLPCPWVVRLSPGVVNPAGRSGLVSSSLVAAPGL